MTFKGKPFRRIRLNIRPKVEFKQILDTLEDLTLPQTNVKSQDIKYAILEMVNNSIRAHRDNKIEEPLTVTFEYANPELTIAVVDKGPGFNPQVLPYSLDDDPNDLDLKSDSFDEYRKKHNYKRFGMGLHLVRKTFSSFELSFLNSDGQFVEWKEGKIRGTCIKVGAGGQADDRA